MNICLSILHDELTFSSQLCNPEKESKTNRYSFLHGNHRMLSEIVYLAKAADLPARPDFEIGASLICTGRPSEYYFLSQLPILLLPPNTDLILVANELGEIFQKYNTLETLLNEAVLSGRGLQELVDIMTPYIKNELSIIDANYLVLAHSFEELRMVSISDMVTRKEKQMLPFDIISFFTNNKRWAEIKTEKEVFIYDEGILDHRLLCLNIISEVEFSCRVAIAETEQPFRPYDPFLLTFFVEYVRKVYERTLIGGDSNEINTLADSLRLVLSGMEVEPWRIKHGLTAWDHIEEAHFLCVCVRPAYRDNSVNTISYYCEQIVRVFSGILAIEFHGDIVCLINLNYYNMSQDAFLKETTLFIRDGNFRMGVSEKFTEVMHFKDHYKQAEIALNCGSENCPSQWIHRFHEQVLNYITGQAIKEVTARSLCASEVIELHNYDTLKSSDYIETMDSYFKNHLNVAQTALSLNIHRATMIYRLKRIKEIAGIDFLDAETNLFYQLSIKLLAMTKQQL